MLGMKESQVVFEEVDSTGWPLVEPTRPYWLACKSKWDVVGYSVSATLSNFVSQVFYCCDEIDGVYSSRYWWSSNKIFFSKALSSEI